MMEIVGDLLGSELLEENRTVEPQPHGERLVLRSAAADDETWWARLLDEVVDRFDAGELATALDLIQAVEKRQQAVAFQPRQGPRSGDKVLALELVDEPGC